MFIAAIKVFSLKFVKWLNLPWLQQQCFCNITTTLRLQMSLYFTVSRSSQKKSDQDTTVAMKTSTVEMFKRQ